jgi:TRAP-type uncharacterized transport system fused permease subunit
LKKWSFLRQHKAKQLPQPTKKTRIELLVEKKHTFSWVKPIDLEGPIYYYNTIPIKIIIPYVHLLCVLFFWFLLFGDRVSICSQGWPWTHNLLASISLVLRFYITPPYLDIFKVLKYLDNIILYLKM